MKFLSKKDVRNLVVLSPTQIARLEAEGQFPKRVRLGEPPYSRVVWVETEVLRWMEERAASRDKTRGKSR